MKLEAILYSMMAITIGTIMFMLIDGALAVSHERSGVIMEKYYSPSQTGIGNSIGTNGHVGIVVTSSSEEYILLINSNGRVFKITCEASSFVNAKIGERIIFFNHTGRFTGMDWGSNVKF